MRKIIAGLCACAMMVTILIPAAPAGAEGTVQAATTEAGAATLAESVPGPAITPTATPTAEPTAAPTAAPTTEPSITFKEAFPDGNFRGVLNEKILTVDLNDSDAFDEKAKAELAAFAGDLDLTGQNISDLTGISYLKEMKSLNVRNNSLTTLTLKDFSKLEAVNVANNKLTTLSISETPNLKRLNADYNNLNVLDISQLTSLQEISCAANDIATLNTVKLKELTSLNARDNDILVLDVSYNTELVSLNVENNKLATLDISRNSKLKTLYADGNELVNFDVSNVKEGSLSDFELRKSGLTLTGVALGTQYGVILPAGAAAPNANSISNGGTYLSTTRSIVWSSLTTIPSVFTYQYTITGSTDVVTVTVVVDKSTMVRDALTVGTPMNFAVADYSYNKLKMTWSGVSGATGYRIYRSTTKTGTYKLIKTITSGTTVSYINSGLACGTTYYYKIRAFREVNGVKYFGSYASIVSRKAKPAKPTLTVSKYSSSKIKLTWTRKAGASGYVIYRSTSKNGTYSKIKTITSGAKVSYINTKRKKRVTYYYKIRTYRTVNGARVYSAYSSIKSKKL